MGWRGCIGLRQWVVAPCQLNTTQHTVSTSTQCKAHKMCMSMANRMCGHRNSCQNTPPSVYTRVQWFDMRALSTSQLKPFREEQNHYSSNKAKKRGHCTLNMSKQCKNVLKTCLKSSQLIPASTMPVFCPHIAQSSTTSGHTKDLLQQHIQNIYAV